MKTKTLVIRESRIETKTKTLVIDYSQYDTIIVAFSGGKDSLGCLLHLLDTGCPKEKIELWHHDIDGREGSDLMDWACTRGYCKAVADAFGIRIYFSWKQGGFEREMLRENAKTAPISFETPDGVVTAGGIRGKEATRRMFPQVSGDLRVRWCSAYLKIDVATIALNNQDRFLGKKTLFLTGERAQESAGRAKYAWFEPHKADNRDGKKVKRHIDHWRPVHKFSVEQVWELIAKYKVNPHPAYRLGWGRVSCAACIFGSANQWASLAKINPKQVQKISGYEKEFGKTIQRKKSVDEQVATGTAYQMSADDIKAALDKEFNEPVILKNWTLPAGAFGESCGPT